MTFVAIGTLRVNSVGFGGEIYSSFGVNMIALEFP